MGFDFHCNHLGFRHIHLGRILTRRPVGRKDCRYDNHLIQYTMVSTAIQKTLKQTPSKTIFILEIGAVINRDVLIHGPER